jgi:hypothetical protein
VWNGEDVFKPLQRFPSTETVETVTRPPRSLAIPQKQGVNESFSMLPEEFAFSASGGK